MVLRLMILFLAYERLTCKIHIEIGNLMISKSWYQRLGFYSPWFFGVSASYVMGNCEYIRLDGVILGW